MVKLSNSNKKQRPFNKFKEEEYNITKHLNPTQTYQITDIPPEYSNNRIKGALKPYGKITELKTIKPKNSMREKTVQVTIEPLPYSKDISGRWSIPLGSIMARIAPASLGSEVWRDRNKYTARLYGTPKATNTVILMRSIKNLKPMTCYIPKCSISGKERNFAIISFRTKEELEKACSSSAKYINHQLTWSKSRTQHLNTSSLPKRELHQSYNGYIQGSKWEVSSETETPFSSSETQEEKVIAGPSKEHSHMSKIEKKTSMSIFSSSSSSNASRPINKWEKKRGKEYKGKGRMEWITEEDSTTNKLIAMISQIASRLDQIENNMGIPPNRS
jgi:hypothetical protein